MGELRHKLQQRFGSEQAAAELERHPCVGVRGGGSRCGAQEGCSLGRRSRKKRVWDWDARSYDAWSLPAKEPVSGVIPSLVPTGRR